VDSITQQVLLSAENAEILWPPLALNAALKIHQVSPFVANAARRYRMINQNISPQPNWITCAPICPLN